MHSSQIKEAVKIKITNAELTKYLTFQPVVLCRIPCIHRFVIFGMYDPIQANSLWI